MQTKTSSFSSLSTENTIALSENGIRCQWFRTIANMPDVWSVLEIEDIFLQKNYLACLEAYPPEDMRFVYWIFYKNEQPIGFVMGQIQHFNAYRSLNALQQTENKKALSFQFKKWSANLIDYHVLLIGNLLVTGEHGFYFSNTAKETLNLADILHEAISKTLPFIKKEKVTVTIFKEYFENSLPPLADFEQKKYNKMSALPNMIISIREDWNTFDDYLKAMSSKYRVRAKRAFKKGKDITKKELDLADIKALNPQIFDLYRQIASKAEFNALRLHSEYFYGLKEYLGDDFRLIGYFYKEELIGFYTMIFGKHEVDAHFLGINDDYNREMQIYLNMLYDLIRNGIDAKTNAIAMARTALEIKSSVGADAHDMFAYVKFKNPVMNLVVRQAVKFFLAPVEWTARSPFKE